MVRHKKIILTFLLGGVFGLLIAVPVFAASSTFYDQAKQFYAGHCTKSSLTPNVAVVCYLFDKVSEIDSDLASLASWVSNLESSSASQSASINDLQQRVYNLENPSPTPSPTPSPSPTPAPNVIVFAQDRPAPFTTDFIPIPTGYTSMTFRVSTTGTLFGWSPIANVNSFVNEQHRFNCSNNVCPEVTIPIISWFYQFSTGTSSGNITATATLNGDPGTSTQVLGYGVDLPFTSRSMPTNPSNSITVTVGQRNPQNITGISLQRKEGDIFVEKERINCDGGAVCPLTSLPLLGGEYRVVVEGSGPGALVAALLKPS